MEAVIPLTQKTIEEVRRIVKDLRPSILDDLGILATINWFCREFQNITPASGLKREDRYSGKRHSLPSENGDLPDFAGSPE